MAEQQVFWAKVEDPAIRWATERARATFRYFWRELSWEYRRIVPALGLATVKAAFSDRGLAVDDEPGPVEHMWLNSITFDGCTVRGVLANEPDQLTGVSKGAAVELPPERLEDWLYVMEGRAYGAFTVNALRKEMDAAQRRAHDEAWGLDFGDPDQPQVVPSPPGRAGLVGRLLGRARPSVPDPDAEHPMSENMGPSLREALTKDRSLLAGIDAQGLTLLHHLALGGSEAGVRVALEFGADRGARTNAGLTARDLAAALGWPRVLALLDSPGRA